MGNTEGGIRGKASQPVQSMLTATATHSGACVGCRDFNEADYEALLELDAAPSPRPRLTEAELQKLRTHVHKGAAPTCALHRSTSSGRDKERVRLLLPLCRLLLVTLCNL